MDKIYEIREDQAWGPNDRGHVIGYIKAESKEDARKKYGSDSGFIQFFEISLEEYSLNLKYAIDNLKALLSI